MDDEKQTASADAPSSGLEVSERLKLMSDGLLNNASLLVSGLVAIVIVPLMLKWLGAESYGIWIVALATAAMLSSVDFGLSSTVTREVSSSIHSGVDSEVTLFVEGAYNGCLLLGALGALVLGILGYCLSGGLHLSAQMQGTAHTVFWLIGLGFLGDQLNLLFGAVLAGLRRFDYLNLLRGGTAVVRTAGIVALLAMGRSIVAIAVWHAIAASVAALASFSVVRRLRPQYRFRVAHLHWDKLRKRLSFALLSQLTQALGSMIWTSGSLLIGIMRGSAAVVPFFVGQKLPLTACGFGWQAADAVFPAVSENQESLSRTREIMRVGTRWVLVLMLPVAILLWIVGPNLLTLWIGKLDPEALAVLRLMSLAILADTFLASPLNVLWGRGAMRYAVSTMLGVVTGTVCLTLVLVPRVGVAGAAWGALLPLLAGGAVLFYFACRQCEASVARMAASVFRGLLFPVAGCAASTYLVCLWAGYGVWPLASACLAGSISYVLLLYVAPGQNEERLFLQRTFRRLASHL